MQGVLQRNLKELDKSLFRMYTLSMNKKIYRYVSSEELNLMKEGSENLGNHYLNFYQANNFHYRLSQRYLHFFENKEDIRLIRPIYKGKLKYDKYYICTFEVPFKTLLFHSGRGRYIEDDSNKVVKAKEYIMNAKKFNPSMIVSIEEDESCFPQER